MTKAFVKSIKIDVSGKEIELTIEQAKKLWDSLTELFETKEVFIPSHPVIIEKERYPYIPMDPQPYPAPWIYYEDTITRLAGVESGSLSCRIQ